jgi:hypothetical protein
MISLHNDDLLYIWRPNGRGDEIYENGHYEALQHQSASTFHAFTEDVQSFQSFLPLWLYITAQRIIPPSLAFRHLAPAAFHERSEKTIHLTYDDIMSRRRLTGIPSNMPGFSTAEHGLSNSAEDSLR